MAETEVNRDDNVTEDHSQSREVKTEIDGSVTDSTVITAGRDVIQKVTQFLGFGPDVQRAQRNRRAMLQLVKNIWVKGVLEQSLHGAAMIELGLEERADAVEHPWDMVLQTDREDRTLPPGTRIIDVFDEMGGNLLILGEPGSGKTTMLLELARDTIARAEQDAEQPIPVVFILSSWAGKKQPIAEWLVEELNTKYNIPKKKLARPWVENDELLLLLDGLDEVAQEYREDCVRAINDFRQKHMVPLVVCSRIADYEALTTRLRPQGAVSLQPLTPQKVNEYLDRAGAELAAVREVLQDDATLQELVETPLMLSIVSLAYRGMSVGDLRKLDSLETRRRHVLDAYVRGMFERRKAEQPYSPKQTTHWLAWLAQKMSVRAQIIFLIEGLQPDWLPARTRRQVRIVARLVVGLVGGLVGGPVGGLRLGLEYGLVAALVGGLVGGLFGGLFWFGLVAALVGGLDPVEPVETLKWSWRRATEGLLYFGLVGGLVSGLGFRLALGLVGGLKVGLSVGLVVGLVGGLVLGLRRVEMETKTAPGQGIRQLAKNALTIGLVVGLVGGLVLGLVVELFFGLAGPVAGLLFGLVYGGEAVILHFALRYVLWRHGYLPWSLIRFLDYAAERIFLRKVGGGYIFVHRLLQDYFASLYQGQ